MKLHQPKDHLLFCYLLFVITILTACSNGVSNQTIPSTDSLEITERFNAGLNRVSESIDIAELDQAHAILDSLIVLADTLNNLDFKAKIAVHRGLVFAYQDRLKEAISILEENLPIAKEHSDQNIYFLFNMRLASFYEDIGDGEKALEYIEIATTFPKEILNSNELFGFFITKGSILSINRRFAEAIDFYQQAIAMADTAVIVSKANLAIAHNNLGLILHNLRRYDEALVEYQKSIDINTANDYRLGLSQNLNNIANAYKSLGDSEKSIEFLLQAVDVNKSVNANSAIVRNYYNLGDTYIGMNEFENAEEYLTMAYNMSKEASFAPGIMYNVSGLSKVSVEKGDPRQAIRFALESLELAKQSNTNDIRLRGYETLSKAYEQLNDFKNALNYQKLYQALNDSMTEIRTRTDIEEVRSSFQFELLSNQNQLLEQQLIVYELHFRRQILYLIILVIVVISIGTILYVINRNKEKIDIKNRQLEILNSEKDTLTKVIVHDLRNPLTGLLGSLELLSEEKLSNQQTELVHIALNSTKKLSEMVDGLLEVSRMKEEPIDESIQLTDIKALCEETLEFFHPKAQLKNIVISSRLEKLSVVTHPPYISRILGNLLSNSLKFSDNNSLINVETSVDNQEMCWKLKIVDQGPGFSESDKNFAFQMFQKLSASPKTGENSSGLGLYTVQLLMQKLGGKVSIENNSPKGAIITCEFPLSKP